MVCDLSLLTKVVKVREVFIKLPNGARLRSLQTRYLSFTVGKQTITLTNVYYILRRNLKIISCQSLDEKDVAIVFENRICSLADSRDEVTCTWIKKRNTDGLYVALMAHYLKQDIVDNKLTINIMEDCKPGKVLMVNSSKLWPNRMGHPSSDVNRRMVQSAKYDMGIYEREDSELLDLYKRETHTKKVRW